MLKTIEVVFDGKTFVPTEPVDLPAGTKLNVAVPEDRTSEPSRLISSNPPPLTEQELQEWEELRRQWASTPLPWATVEEAISYSRGRPWPEFEPMPEEDNDSDAPAGGKEGNS